MTCEERSIGTLAIRYALFAAIATAINLAAQAGALGMLRGPYRLTAAMALGTGLGLVTKYILDKRWIFFNSSRGRGEQGRQFALYAVTGVITTALFWGLEYGGDALTTDGRWRFVGASVGLTLGYIYKYRLDRRYVFREAPS